MHLLKLSSSDLKIQLDMFNNKSTPEYFRSIAGAKICAASNAAADCDRFLNKAGEIVNSQHMGSECVMQYMITLIMCCKFREWSNYYSQTFKVDVDVELRLGDSFALRNAYSAFFTFVRSSKIVLTLCYKNFVSDTDTEVYIRRVIYFLPQILVYVKCRSFICGCIAVNLSDYGDETCLSFSGHKIDWLIPDPIFLYTCGYKKQRDAFEADYIPWAEKSRLIFWRGATTGPHPDLDVLPRYKLCKWANATDWRSHCDIGFSSVVQIKMDDEKRISNEGLLKNYVEDITFNRFAYHVDIDGNTNSWPGFFLKLLSGGVVIKIESERECKQWYYSRMIPWRDFVPVRSDLSDLDCIFECVLREEPDIKKIAANGSKVANRMKFRNEMAMACNTIRRYIKFGALA